MKNESLKIFSSYFKSKNRFSIHGYLADTLSNILSFVFISLLFFVIYAVTKSNLDFESSILTVVLFIFLWVMSFGLLSVFLEIHKNLKYVNLKLKFQNEITYLYFKKHKNLVDLDEVIESLKSDSDSNFDSFDINNFAPKEANEINTSEETNNQKEIADNYSQQSSGDNLKNSEDTRSNETLVNIGLFIGIFILVSFFIVIFS